MAAVCACGHRRQEHDETGVCTGDVTIYFDNSTVPVPSPCSCEAFYRWYIDDNPAEDGAVLAADTAVRRSGGEPMTGRDAARDELITTLRGTTIRILPDRTLDLVADALLARGYRRSVTPEEVVEPQWEIRVRVPMRLPEYRREALFEAVAEAVHDWEPADRDGWDADVSGGPEQDQARAFGLEVTE